MSIEADLASAGWHLSPEGIDLCCQGLNNPTLKDVTKRALDLDFKEVGRSCLPEDINRGRVESLVGGMVLMVTKIRNVAAPKVKEESGAAPRMLKISLTDGSTTCHAVEVDEIKSVSLKTPPGTKIKLAGGRLEVANGFVKVSERNLEVLGGEVEALLEKWKVSQSLAEFTRSGVTGEGGQGPPKWIPFGQKNKMPKQDPNNKHFKSIATKASEPTEEGEFESKRQEAVQEAAKGEQKKFAAGSKNIKDSRVRREEEREKRREEREKSDSQEAGDPLELGERDWGERGRGGRGGRGRGRGRRDRDEAEPGQAPPSQPSLFDFLQGQIPNPVAAVSQAPPRQETREQDRASGAKTDFKYEARGRGEREKENKDFKPRKDADKPKSGKDGYSRRDNFQDRKSQTGDRTKDENRKKENPSNGFEGRNKREAKNSNSRNNSQSQNKEFNPIFHGRTSGADQSDKLDKYERSLFSEDFGPSKSNNSSARNSGRPQNREQREHSQADLSGRHQSKKPSQSSNSYPSAGGRHAGGGGGSRGDQDFGQWNGQRNMREDLAAGFQNMSLGPSRSEQQDQARRGQRTGYQGDRRGGGGDGGVGGNQRPSGGQDRRGGSGGGNKPNWAEGQKCLAKYWEVSTSADHYVIVP